MSKVTVDKDDLFKLLEYMDLLNEKKDWEQNGKPDNHIWIITKNIRKEVKYKG